MQYNDQGDPEYSFRNRGALIFITHHYNISLEIDLAVIFMKRYDCCYQRISKEIGAN